jgi:hypothetical protein
MPYIEDASLVSSNAEFMKKRAYMPAEQELSPYVNQRFRDLLEANRGNKLAYECLMLYNLLDGQLEPFAELYGEVGNYFSEPVGVYEEAILIYDRLTLSDSTTRHKVSQAALDRYGEFSRLAQQYEGDQNLARKVLYHEMGQSYMYYLGFLYPRIVKPEVVNEEYDEAPI